MCPSMWDADYLAWCLEQEIAAKPPRGGHVTKVICKWSAELHVHSEYSRHQAKHDQMAKAYLSCSLEGARIQDL